MNKRLDKSLVIKISRAVLLLFILQIFSADFYKASGKVTIDLASAATSMADKAKRFAALVGGLTAGVFTSIKNTPFDSPELSFGSPDLMVTYQRDLDVSTGYSDQTATVEPFSVSLVVGFILGYFPAKSPINVYWNSLQTLTAEQLFFLDFGILLSNVLFTIPDADGKPTRRVSMADFPVQLNRLFMKVSLTQDASATARQGKTVLSRMAQNGPAEYFGDLPQILQKPLNVLKYPISDGIQSIARDFHTSKVAKRLWEIAASSRSKTRLSERNSEAHAWVDLVSKQGKDFTAYDKNCLTYWLHVHAGEWSSKAFSPAEKESLKASVKSFYSDMGNALTSAGLSDIASTVKDIQSKIDTNTVPMDWMTNPFPEPSNSGRHNAQPKELLEHMWSVFTLSVNPSFITKYPFAGGNKAFGQNYLSLMITAIFNQHDLDINAALQSFQNDTNGKPLYDAQQTALQDMLAKYRAMRQAKTDTYADAKQAYNDAFNAYRAAKNSFRTACAAFPYITDDEQLQSTLDATQPKAVSADARMYTRFKELQLLAPAAVFNAGLRSNTGLLVGMGIDIDQLFTNIANADIDNTKSYIMTNFASESASTGAADALPADPTATPDGSAVSPGGALDQSALPAGPAAAASGSEDPSDMMSPSA